MQKKVNENKNFGIETFKELIAERRSILAAQAAAKKEEARKASSKRLEEEVKKNLEKRYASLSQAASDRLKNFKKVKEDLSEVRKLDKSFLTEEEVKGLKALETSIINKAKEGAVRALQSLKKLKNFCRETGKTFKYKKEMGELYKYLPKKRVKEITPNKPFRDLL